jgi:hypothetical protein
LTLLNLYSWYSVFIQITRSSSGWA